MYCTINQAAATLSVSTKTIRRMVESKTLHAHKVPGVRALRIPIDQLRLPPAQELLSKQEFPKTTHKPRKTNVRSKVWE